MLDDNIVKSVANQLAQLYAPDKILLFGSQAKGTAGVNSDIDLCVVIATDNKRRLIADMYYTIDAQKPVDILLYTPEEWQMCIADKTSFAYQISREGVLLHG